MICLRLRFDLGRYHANPWGSHVNDAACEWPPSPWRLIRALYSVARTHVGLADQIPAIDRGLTGLAGSAPPVFKLPPAAAGHTRHYIPKASYSSLAPTQKDKILDGFVAIDPAAAIEAWWDVDLDPDASVAVAAAAARLGYLGRSESVCSAELLDVPGRGPEGALARAVDSLESVEEETELVDLLCPSTDTPLAEIAISITKLRGQRKLVPPGARRVTYALPKLAASENRSKRPFSTRPTMALLRLRGAARPGLTEAVAAGQALRGAAQKRFDKSSGGRSTTFSGHAGDERRTDQHQHAHFLALTDPNSRRVDRLVAWAPEGFGPGEVAALANITGLGIHGIPERLPCALTALGGENELHKLGLVGPTKSWRSLTPFGLVRHPKRRRGGIVDSPEDQIRAELLHRKLPEPERIEFLPGSWHRFRGSKMGSSRLKRARLVGVRLRFAEPVLGPIAIGALSHYGLGLMTPDD